MQILRIDSSVRIENSKTRMLTDYFLEQLKTTNDYILTTRDVGINPPSFPTDTFIKANYTPASNRTAQMKSDLAQSDILIDELIDADRIVIAAPMYNFSISATLKAYIDNIVRIGRTFSLDENGAMKGLLVEKKLLVITSRGAASYENGGFLENFDFQQNYLRSLFSFMGITDVTFVNVEAQDFGEESLKMSNFKKCKTQLLALSKKW